MTQSTNTLRKRICFPWFKRQTASERRENNPVYIRHRIIQRNNELENDTENPELAVSIADMRETIDDYLYEHGILLPDDQLEKVLHELNFHRDNATKFQIELTKSLSKLDANT